ncbi:MAG: efflux RND transporter periplasmic adaptor subunit [Thermoanaerobaculia bacterium]|nr:efflux RND transporter periplasmic adaptor subunit [Thermoanaerobaculia bacterium]
MNSPSHVRLLWICAALLPIVLLTTGCGNTDSEAAVMTETATTEATSVLDRPIEVETVRLALRSVDDRVDLPADILPFREATLAAEVPGVVRKVHAGAGDWVEAGEVLLEIDTETSENQLAEATAVHRQAQAQFERAEALLAKKSITQQQFLDAITQRDVAVTQLARAKLQLAKSKVKAPWAGTVSVQRLEAGDYAQPGQPAFDLVDVAHLKVVAPAPASDVPFLETGLPAHVQVDVFPGETFDGEVTRLGTMLDAGARTLDVEVEIVNPNGNLRPGLAARLSIPLRQTAEALVLPLDAVIDLGDSDAVYVLEDGRAQRRLVEVGRLLAGDRAVIDSGLSPGDEIIVVGQKQVSPGQRVVTPES